MARNVDRRRLADVKRHSQRYWTDEETFARFRQFSTRAVRLERD